MTQIRVFTFDERRKVVVVGEVVVDPDAAISMDDVITAVRVWRDASDSDAESQADRKTP